MFKTLIMDSVVTNITSRIDGIQCMFRCCRSFFFSQTFFYLRCPCLGSNIPNIPKSFDHSAEAFILVRIMTFSEPVSHSEPGLIQIPKSFKFCDIIHVETISFVYQWFHK